MSEIREKNRSHTAHGPGVMPFTKTSKSVGSKLWKKCPLKRRGDPKRNASNPRDFERAARRAS